MRVSSKADYAVRALFDLAQRYGQGPIQSRDIAQRQNVSEAYLHQVLSALGRAGFVRSTRGPLGGHELLREPREISLWEVIATLDGQEVREHPHDAVTDANDVVHETWHELQERTVAFLSGLTLQDLIDRASAKRPVGNYTI